MRRGGAKQEVEKVTIDIERLRPILEHAATHGAAAAADEFKLPKTYIQSLLSLARKFGAAPAAVRGGSSLDPAEVVAALETLPLWEVEARFQRSAQTLLKIAAQHKKAQKSGSAAAAPAEPPQAVS
jgi:hypothetical protein